jgi:hypothetical protein
MVTSLHPHDVCAIAGTFDGGGPLAVFGDPSSLLTPPPDSEVNQSPKDLLNIKARGKYKALEKVQRLVHHLFMFFVIKLRVFNRK